MQERMKDTLVIDAFNSAWESRLPDSGLIFHSDRGRSSHLIHFSNRIYNSARMFRYSRSQWCYVWNKTIIDEDPGEEIITKFDKFQFSNYTSLSKKSTPLSLKFWKFNPVLDQDREIFRCLQYRGMRAGNLVVFLKKGYDTSNHKKYFQTYDAVLTYSGTSSFSTSHHAWISQTFNSTKHLPVFTPNNRKNI